MYVGSRPFLDLGKARGKIANYSFPYVKGKAMGAIAQFSFIAWLSWLLWSESQKGRFSENDMVPS